MTSYPLSLHMWRAWLLPLVMLGACLEARPREVSTPTVTITQLSPGVITPSGQATLSFSSSADGSYVVVGADSPEAVVLSRGTVSAQQVVSTPVSGSALPLGSIQLTVWVWPSAGNGGNVGNASTTLVVTGAGGASGSSGPSGTSGPFTIGGGLNWLSPGTPVTLHNGGDSLVVGASGPFVFPTQVPTGASFNVTATPSGCTALACGVQNGTGVATSTTSRLPVARRQCSSLAT